MATQPLQEIHEIRSPHVSTLEIQPDNDGKFECPECRMTAWKSRAGLGMHRAVAHNVRGSHPRTVRAFGRKPHKAKHLSFDIKSLHRNSDGKFTCPECGRNKRTKTDLVVHLRQHGIKSPYSHPIAKQNSTTRKLRHVTGQLRGSRHTPILTADVKPVRGKYPCPECRAPFPTARVLGRHRMTHGILGTGKSAAKRRERKQEALATQSNHRRENGNHADHTTAPRTITTPVEALDRERELEKTIVWHGGVTCGRLQVFAESQDIPWPVFAEGVAELLRLSSGRRVVGRPRNLPALRSPASGA